NDHASSPKVELPTRRLHASKPALRPSSSNSSLNVNGRTSPLASSSLPHLVDAKQPASNHHQTNHTSRTRSPLPQTDHADLSTKENGSASKTPATGTRFGWQFPRHKAPLPPLELD